MNQTDFVGAALPLDGDGFQTSLDTLAIRAPELWAVIQVETSGVGFQMNRTPTILYERHVFHRLTQGRFDGDPSGISNADPGGYGPSGSHQYDRLLAAAALDETAALQSASWGMGQVMGFHATSLGYADVKAMVRQMCAKESEQLAAMARFIDLNGLASALRAHDWARFAKGYNGANYQINRYDTRLASAHAALERGVPDLDIRAGQLMLAFLSFDPHGIDGVMGRMTRAAMNDFQAAQGLPATTDFDAPTLDALRAAVAALPR